MLQELIKKMSLRAHRGLDLSAEEVPKNSENSTQKTVHELRGDITQYVF